MSKQKSTETLVKLTHGTSVEELELKDKIDLLTNMISHPNKSKRYTYIASHLYDKKGNFNTDHWEYQLVGTATITSVPIVLIFGTAITTSLVSGVEFSDGFLLATSGMVLAEIGAIAGTNAYMTIKGSKMATEIREGLTTNLESIGYQITPNNEPLKTSIDSYKINNERLLEGEVISTGNNKYIHLIEEDEFVAKIANLINQIMEKPYPRFSFDIIELKQTAIDWMAINLREYKRTGKKLDISHAPIHIYDALESEVLSKINKTLKKVSRKN